ncbi:MAG: M23 family metallopeptidase [Gemmatimonadota bacterium]|nr:MAG: M23 family metallopeptidase [Gemmatimonadota bacterium]
MWSKALKLVVPAGIVLATAIWTTGIASSSKPLPVAAPIVVDNAYVYQTDAVKRNETLSHLFGRHNIYGNELIDVLDAADGLNPRRIKADKAFDFRYTVGNSKPDRISVRMDDASIEDDKILTLYRDSSGTWASAHRPVVWSVDVLRVTGVIQENLDQAMREAVHDTTLPAAQRAIMVNDLADNIYGWVIDFARDFYEGDKVTVVYERLSSQLGDIRYGRVLAAEIETRGRKNYAYVMTDERGRNTYYDDQGLSLRRSFKIRPVSFGRLSSRFSRSRFHPVLKTYRPHYGIDYAAPTGTEIEATNSGTVTRAGRWGTYGIMVSVRHAQGVETRYGHMRSLARGIEPGVRVEQGQVLGYVGMTGLATAPHVHYEILKHGVHRDPRDLLEKEPGKPIAPGLRDEFESVMAQYNALLRGRQPRFAAAAHDN